MPMPLAASFWRRKSGSCCFGAAPLAAAGAAAAAAVGWARAAIAASVVEGAWRVGRMREDLQRRREQVLS